jgi:hypothetical protein
MMIDNGFDPIGLVHNALVGKHRLGTTDHPRCDDHNAIVDLLRIMCAVDDHDETHVALTFWGDRRDVDDVSRSTFAYPADPRRVGIISGPHHDDTVRICHAGTMSEDRIRVCDIAEIEVRLVTP